MAVFTHLLVASASLCLVCSTNAPIDPRVQIDASGNMIKSRAKHKDQQDISLDGFTAMIQKAQAAIRRSHKTVSLVRTEVRRHLPTQLAAAGSGEDLEMRRTQMDEALGLLELGDVKCDEEAEQADPVSGKLCRILHGNNPQIAGKLERAVKGLSLRPKSVNATEMVVADAAEDHLLTHLKAALWDLWFCAKRADPPCDPLTSSDAKVKASRETAFDALHAIHMHAEDHSQTQAAPAAPDASTSAAAALPKAAGVWPAKSAAASLLQKDNEGPPADPPAAADPPACMAGCNGDVCDLAEDETRCGEIAKGPSNPRGAGACTCGKDCTAAENASITEGCQVKPFTEGAAVPAAGAEAPTSTADSTAFATKTLNRMLTAPNVTGNLWDAIGNIDIDSQLEKDIIRITEDEDGNMKKMKSNMLLLHECASMPDCPGDGCCTPKNPTQAIYLQARNDAYIAYHQIQEDDNLGKQAYLELMGNIAHDRPHDPNGKAMKAYHASMNKQNGKKEFPPRSCRHKTYNDTDNPNRMKTGAYCADEDIQSADADGNVLKEKDIDKCTSWDCVDTGGANGSTTDSCQGQKFYQSPDPCWEAEKPSKVIEVKSAPVEAGGTDLLLIAIVVVTVFVLGAIGFLISKTKEGKGGAAAAPAEESWGEEGYGEGAAEGAGGAGGY